MQKPKALKNSDHFIFARVRSIILILKAPNTEMAADCVKSKNLVSGHTWIYFG